MPQQTRPRPAPVHRRAAVPRRARPWLSCGAAAAVLAAAGVLAPATTLPSASAAPVPVTPQTQVVDVPPADGAGGVAATGPVDAEGFSMLSVSWEGDEQTRSASEGALVEARVRADDGWSGWQELELDDAGPDASTPEGRVAATTAATEPLWVSGGADGVDVRVSGPGAPAQGGVVVNLIDPGTSAADPSGQGAPTAPGAPAASASASSADPGPDDGSDDGSDEDREIVGSRDVITRAQWGADETLRTDTCEQVAYAPEEAKAVFVHHTAGTNEYTAEESAEIVRGIYEYHTQVQGWCDIGYNVLVDKYGQIFEGRYGGLDRDVIGAHTIGFNSESWGVAVLGNYETSGPTLKLAGAMPEIVGRKVSGAGLDPQGKAVLTSGGTFDGSRYPEGVEVTVDVIAGHRDVGITECPGENLYAALPWLRETTAQRLDEA